MDGRLSKALMGLGGTGAAAAGGGLYLNDFLTRRKLLAEEEKKANDLETKYKNDGSNNGFNKYLMRSHYQQDFKSRGWGWI